MTDPLAPIRSRVATRLAQHRENLAAWAEGSTCPCKIARGYRGPNPDCTGCNGSGIQGGTRGYLVPSEPDPDERDAVRRELRAAIAELEGIEAVIGMASQAAGEDTSDDSVTRDAARLRWLESRRASVRFLDRRCPATGRPDPRWAVCDEAVADVWRSGRTLGEAIDEAMRIAAKVEGPEAASHDTGS